MWDFLRIFCLVGLPGFAAAAGSIWRPIPTGGERLRSRKRRVLFTIAALVIGLVTLVGLLALPAVAWRIWRKPLARPNSVVDRSAWTTFALGVCLMLTMAVFAMTKEGDGDWRTFETIRLHSRVFLGLALFAIAGPLAAYLAKRWGGEGPAGLREAPLGDGS
jgi:uncharacterized membrane protein